MNGDKCCFEFSNERVTYFATGTNEWITILQTHAVQSPCKSRSPSGERTFCSGPNGFSSATELVVRNFSKPRNSPYTLICTKIRASLRTMTDPIKLGILSTAGIATTILNAVKPLSIIKVVAVASRTLPKAESYARDRNIPIAVTYEDLLEQDLDAVYIPLPTAMAHEWAAKCARAGMHVLVDKPLESVKAIELILEACKEGGVYYMDAVHYVHAKRTAMVRDMVKRGEIGKVRRIVSSFCIPIAKHENIRVKPELEPMGSLGDLGFYIAKSVVAFLGVDLARKILSVNVDGSFHEDYPGAIDRVDGYVVFGEESDKVILNFRLDMSCCWEQTVDIMGTLGKIELPDFVVPYGQTDIFEGLRPAGEYSTKLEIITTKSVSGFDEHNDPKMTYPAKDVQVVEDVDGLSQVSKMMMEFARMIREKDQAAADKWATESLATQNILDMIYEKIKQ